MADERQLPMQRAEGAAFFVLLVQSAAALVAGLLAWTSGSTAAEAAAWLMLVGAVVWLACLLHQRLRRLADDEAREAEATRTEHEAEEGTSLFEADDALLLTARNRLGQFEKYFLPALSILILLALGGLSAWLLVRLTGVSAWPAVRQGSMTAVVFVGMAFVSLLLAMYTAGLATQKPWRALRPGANYTMACAIASFLVALGIGGTLIDLPVAERVVAYAIAGLLGLLAVETLLNLVMGLYRPRVAGREARAAHDSRLLGTLTTSGGILRATAETLDYQFGWKISETWFYRFMERAIVPLIFFQLVTLYLLSCFVIVDTGEQAIIERFGRPRSGRTSLGPGLHLKWPWPFEIAYKHPVGRVEMLMVGEQLKKDVDGYQWTVSHAHGDFHLLVADQEEEQRRAKRAAGPPGDRPDGAAPEPPKGAAARPEGREAPAVSLLAGTAYVYYKVDNYYDFLYTHVEPRRMLESICYRELTRYAAQADFLEFLGHGLAHAAKALKKRIQARADEFALGVAVTDVVLRGLHPPIKAGEAFEAVVGAMEEREAKKWEARSYEAAIVAQAQAKAAAETSAAEAYKYDREQVSPAVAVRFAKQLDAHNQAKDVFRHRTLVRALEAALATTRKLIKPKWVKTEEVTIIDTSDTLKRGTFDLDETDLEGAQP